MACRAIHAQQLVSGLKQAISIGLPASDALDDDAINCVDAEPVYAAAKADHQLLTGHLGAAVTDATRAREGITTNTQRVPRRARGR